MTQQINLPSLPQADIGDAGSFMSGVQVIALESAQDYARAAIKHDRQTRGEPVAQVRWRNGEVIVHWKLPRGSAPLDAGTLLYLSPQPADPVVKESLTVAELVKVPSEEALLSAFITHTKRLYTGDPKDHKDWPAYKAGFEAAQNAASTEPCKTCNDNGAVGNILNAEPCPDCTPPADGQAQQKKCTWANVHPDCAMAQQDAEKVGALAFQARVQPWMMECFGPMIAGDREERNHRFLEEALELVQACGCTASEAHQLVDYVFSRPVGDPHQEVGGVMVTLAALCLANSLDMHTAGETELARIWTKVDQIRAKQAAKPKHSPLPVAPAQPDPAMAGDDRAEFEAWHATYGIEDGKAQAWDAWQALSKLVQPAIGEDAGDAARYRWLRDITGGLADGPWVSIGDAFMNNGSDYISGGDLDAAIDAAMQQGSQP